jgi:hypothetical protein
MKRALSLLLAVVMVLCVVSCGGKPELKFGSYNATASVQMGEMAMTWNMVLSLNLDMTFTLVNDKGEEKGAGTFTVTDAGCRLNYADERTCELSIQEDGSLVNTTDLPFGAASIGIEQAGAVTFTLAE